VISNLTAETATVRLSYIINHDVMRAALQNFSARTGIALAADSADGYQIPPGLPQNDFCMLDAELWALPDGAHLVGAA